MSSYSSSSLKAEVEHRTLVLLHWLSLPLIIGIVGVGAYRSFILAGIRNRMDIVVITAGAKSLLCLAYILAATHISSFKRLYSPRAVFVISIIDSVFWIAALGLTAYGMVQIPSTGTREVLNYVLIALLAIVFLISLPVLYYAFRQDRHVRRIRQNGGESEVEMVQDEYRPRK